MHHAHACHSLTCHSLTALQPQVLLKKVCRGDASSFGPTALRKLKQERMLFKALSRTFPSSAKQVFWLCLSKLRRKCVKHLAKVKKQSCSTSSPPCHHTHRQEWCVTGSLRQTPRHFLGHSLGTRPSPPSRRI